MPALGLTPPLVKPGDLYHDSDYSVGQALAAAIARGCEGLLIPSATALGHSLIAFTDNLRSNSRIEAVSTTAYPLFVDKS